MKNQSFACLNLIFIAQTIFAQINPNEVTDLGMSPSRLSRVDTLLQTAVDNADIGSSVALISREGAIAYHDAFGFAGPQNKMPKDAIVRLASITKPITATGIMILYERGKLRLTDPVKWYIPEFDKLMVTISKNDGSNELRKITTDITIYHLLTHQSGIESGWDKLDPVFADSKTSLDFSRKLAKLPLKFEPGLDFEYGPNYDVLAAIIEIISKKTLKEFFAEEILEPLKMHDTYFQVPAQKLSRLSAVYTKKDDVLTIRVPYKEDGPPTQFYSGGGSLKSTVTDYLRFCEMLMNGGELDGRRILSPKSVQLMTTNHVKSLFDSENRFGWGFGVAIQLVNSTTDLGSVNSYGWNGGSGTIFICDPVEQLIAILFIPSHPGTPGIYDLRKKFIALAYQSIVRSYVD